MTETFTADQINSRGIEEWMRQNGYAQLRLIAEAGAGDGIRLYEAPDGARVMATNAEPVWGGELPQCEDCADIASSICGCGAIRCEAHAHDTCAHSCEDEQEAAVWSALWPTSLRRDCFNY